MSTSTALILLLLLMVVGRSTASTKFNGYERPNTGEPGGVIVHLMDWRYDDIAYECERILPKRGFAGVQVSPITEYLTVVNQWFEGIARFFSKRPWYPRHQVVSYRINTPSGNEEEFKSMVHRCNKAGIKVYVDVVLNHMSCAYARDNVGCAGSVVDTVKFQYPGVPYTTEDFNQPQCIVDEVDAKLMRNCEFRQLHDLNQTNPCVREKMRAFLNKVISFGVAGFRVGHVKHMWPEDLQRIFGHLDYLNCDEGFACDTPPYIYQDYYDTDTKSSVKRKDYYPIGRMVDHKYAQKISNIFFHSEKPIDFGTIQDKWQLLDTEKSVVFVDTYETQRETSYIVSYKQRNLYKLAVALLLASPLGQPLITSSYKSKKGEDPPYTEKGGTFVATNQQSTCASGWICEHRRKYIASMIKFKEIVEDAPVTNWWHDGRYRFAFCRSNKGFVLINNNSGEIKNQRFQTDLPPGTYCDIISGDVSNGQCTGSKVTVNAEGLAHVALLISSDKGEGLLVIHVGAMAGE